MGKINLVWHASLDGVASNLESWMEMPNAVIEDSGLYYNTLDALIIGGNSYQGLAEYWQQAETKSASDVERAFARRINEMKKYVMSRSPKELVWNNSEQLLIRDAGDLGRQLKDLKRKHRKDISVESGIGTWQLFLRHHLYDRIRIFVHPVIAGEGQQVLEKMRLQPLEAIKTDTFPGGIVATLYEKKG